jgi:NAD(P)-dependent dehydrogenase (short-subunit alcohol dehydrogenase family)
LTEDRLEGKVVLVTGASRGIGATIAKYLAAEGARVVLNSRSGADKVADDIKGSGGTVLDIKADISDSEQVMKMFSTIKEAFGDVDILINNACGPISQVPFEQSDWKAFETQIDSGLKGAFLCIKNSLPGMLAKKQGRIISILSSYAAGVPPPSLSHYVTGKYAMMGFSRSLAVELAPKGIAVNMVSPGITKTELTSSLPEMALTLAARQNPMRRIASTDDVAQAVIFLCKSSFINGANIMVCGGSVMG